MTCKGMGEMKLQTFITNAIFGIICSLDQFWLTGAQNGYIVVYDKEKNCFNKVHWDT